jgi:tRNA dimethylallyltransferase
LSGTANVPGVVAIVGPTASGKTSLALRAAEALGAEIVSADSRLVYRGMDIGTAKPTPLERARVRHHCIDLVEPGERYDAARYQRDARAAVADIAARGRPAIVVGGTGLYVRALLDGLDLAARPAEATLRARIEDVAWQQGRGAVFASLREADPVAAARAGVNLRRAIRYLEIALLRGSVPAAGPAEPLPAMRIGLAPPRSCLDRAITDRVERMIENGVLEETRTLVSRGLDLRLPSMTAHGYVHWAGHLAGDIPLDEAKRRTTADTRAYARRQMTWFRRDPLVRWVDPAAADPLPAVLEAAG